MKQNAKHILFLLALLLVFILPVQALELHENNAEASEEHTKTIEQILEKRKNFHNQVRDRASKKIVNILIVPGHDDNSWGAKFGSLKEVELNRKLAHHLHQYLSKEEGINPVLASDDFGYSPIFETYFNAEKEKIQEFILKSKEEFSQKLTTEHISEVDNDFHNPATEDVVHRLYGINRWVNTQDFDLVIHIHFNDYRGRKKSKIGKYDGFSIYTPGKLFENYELSKNVADSVFEELAQIRPVSNLKSEEAGVIEDHELIALGANETLEAGSILIEYGYIYEPIFTDPDRRGISLDYLAYATYAGIMNTLGEQAESKVSPSFSISKNKTTADNLAWQFQKALEGSYPPEGKILRDCPISGYFGKCSEKVK